MTDEEIKKLFHNLKNDFASMTALLNLHKLYKNHISSEEMLNRVFERQIVIATVYEKLYQEDDYPNVGLLLFINELLSRESQTLQTYTRSVQIKKEIIDIRLPIRKITPLGQILVELLSNSYRHAFLSTNLPEIEFRITKKEEAGRLEYQDNGCGFDDGFLPLKSRTLGMQFITALSKQLGGSPLLKNGKTEGIFFSLEFEVPR